MKWTSVKEQTPPGDKELLVLITIEGKPKDDLDFSFIVRCARYSYFAVERGAPYETSYWDIRGERQNNYISTLLSSAITHWAPMPSFEDGKEPECVCKKIKNLFGYDGL